MVVGALAIMVLMTGLPSASNNEVHHMRSINADDEQLEADLRMTIFIKHGRSRAGEPTAICRLSCNRQESADSHSLDDHIARTKSGRL